MPRYVCLLDCACCKGVIYVLIKRQNHNLHVATAVQADAISHGDGFRFHAGWPVPIAERTDCTVCPVRVSKFLTQKDYKYQQCVVGCQNKFGDIHKHLINHCGASIRKGNTRCCFWVRNPEWNQVLKIWVQLVFVPESKEKEKRETCWWSTHKQHPRLNRLIPNWYCELSFNLKQPDPRYVQTLSTCAAFKWAILKVYIKGFMSMLKMTMCTLNKST